MPNNLALGSFVLGSFLLVLAIAGGGFKLFGAEFSHTISSRALRTLAGVLGLIFILVAFIDPSNIFRFTDNPSTFTQSPPSGQEPQEQPVEPDGGCEVYITHPFVEMKSEPEVQSESVGRASLGRHAVLNDQRTEFAGQQQLWYLIDDGGQQGWVQYLPMTMEKEGDCP